MTFSKTFSLDVISDVMCPWCYIGKRRLEGALALVPEHELAVRWRPFQLDASIPPEGMDRKAYLQRKFGDDAGGSMYERIREAGREEAIPFRFDKITRSPNTLNAHRVIRWAATAGHQDAVVEALFAAYFVEGRDIGDPQVLTDIAAAAGMDGTLTAELLATEADIDLVRREIDLAHQYGVEGVPAFILADRFIVMGAQSADLLANAIRTVADQLDDDGAPASDPA